MKRLYERQQRTLARPIDIQGIGYLTGQMISLRFRPAPAWTGVVFVRTDLGGACIPASIDQVTGTQRRTTLGHAPMCVGLVEHVLAALAGLRIDNCYIDLNGCEPPGLDGSALQFVQLLREAGIRSQSASRTGWTVEKPVVVRQRDCTLALHPGTHGPLRISYFLDYGPRSPIDRQLHTQDVTPTSFGHDLAGCRTFLLEAEAHAFRKQGLGARTQINDLLVFGPKGPIDNHLRFANEPARHKILDIIGDLSLFGHDLCGHVVAYRSGHPLNVELARTLSEQLAHLLPCSARAA